MSLLLLLFTSINYLTDSCIPTSPVTKPPIPCDSCPSFTASGFASDTSSVDANGCAVRTLACGAAASTNTLIRYNGATDIAGTGTMTFAVTCNAGNSAWLYMGTTITQAECFEPCQSCPPVLIGGPPLPTLPFSADTMSVDGSGCAVRTLECTVATWQTAVISTYPVPLVPDFLVDNAVTVAISVTCNAANTAWIYASPTGTNFSFLPLFLHW